MHSAATLKVGASLLKADVKTTTLDVSLYRGNVGSVSDVSEASALYLHGLSEYGSFIYRFRSNAPTRRRVGPGTLSGSTGPVDREKSLNPTHFYYLRNVGNTGLYSVAIKRLLVYSSLSTARTGH
jgi:hypothetical protein